MAISKKNVFRELYDQNIGDPLFHGGSFTKPLLALGMGAMGYATGGIGPAMGAFGTTHGMIQAGDNIAEKEAMQKKIDNRDEILDLESSVIPESSLTDEFGVQDAYGRSQGRADPQSYYNTLLARSRRV